MDWPEMISDWSLGVLCVVSGALRLLLICWGRIQDYAFDVPFTDIDYSVFTAAARALSEGANPYEAVPTYRYSPHLALLCLANLDVPDAGKLLFNAADLLSSVLVYGCLRRLGQSEATALLSAGLWLFNPFTMIISSRGSGEALVSLSVLATLYLLLAGRWTTAALVHGALAIPLKIYPLIYAPSIFLFLLPASERLSYERPFGSLRALLLNWRGWAYGLICAASAAGVTWLSYARFGDPFLEAALLYHVGRVDVRHNFSPYWLLFYLAEGTSWARRLGLAAFIPQAAAVLILSFRFARSDLPFAWMTVTLAFVALNKVVTSQYFVWYLCLLPVAWVGLRGGLSVRQAGPLLAAWLGAQALWLALAYQVEFRGRELFVPLGLAGLAFLFVNGWILAALVTVRGQALKSQRSRLKED